MSLIAGSATLREVAQRLLRDGHRLEAELLDDHAGQDVTAIEEADFGALLEAVGSLDVDSRALLAIAETDPGLSGSVCRQALRVSGALFRPGLVRQGAELPGAGATRAVLLASVTSCRRGNDQETAALWDAIVTLPVNGEQTRKARRPRPNAARIR